MSIPSGRYIVANVQHKNLAFLPKDDHETSLATDYRQNIPNEEWKVKDLGNGYYSIENFAHKMFASTLFPIKDGDHVIGKEEGSRWLITKSPTGENYAILTHDRRFAWWLNDNEKHTPITLHPHHSTNAQCLWTFRRIHLEDESDCAQDELKAAKEQAERADGTETTYRVEEVDNYKYLGVLINRKLSWKSHHSLVHARAVKYTNLFRRLVKTTKGISYAGARMLYNAVAIAQINYACDVWYSPPAQTPENPSIKGSAGITKKLASVQRQATVAITGALRTTAADILEIHAGIPPVQVRLGRLCNSAAARAATLTSKHPLYRVAKAKAKRLVKRHRTALHLLFHTTSITPERMEKISPTRRSPNYHPPHRTRIDPTKEAALEHDTMIQDRGIRIYTDGSGYGNNIGAAAVLYDNGRRKSTLRYHLGSVSEHTVFEGEIVGILLGLKMAVKSRAATNGRLDISISLDNTSAITALNNQLSKPSQYLLDWIHDTLEDMDEDLAERLEITWVPGHMNARGNEAADEEARKAAEGNSSPAPKLPHQLRDILPVSLSATRQNLTKIASRTWDDIWKRSSRFRHAKRIVGKASSPKYVKLVKARRRNQTSALTQLRTRHIPLNFYLNRIKKADNADCPHCPGRMEDVEHFLFNCRQYHTARTELRNEVGRKSTSLGYLLGTLEGTKHLLRYMHETRRFEHTLGRLWTPEDDVEIAENQEEA